MKNNPSGTFLWKSSEWWDSFGQFMMAIGALIASIGVLIGVIQYTQQVEAARAKETLALIEKWESGGYRDSFAVLRDATDRFQETVPRNELKLVRSSTTARENFQRKLYDSVFADGDHFEDFDHIVSFFDRLGLCIQAKLCSEKTAEVYFRTTLGAFLFYYDGLVLERGLQYAGYVEGLQFLKNEFSINAN
ncbi:DUF4760 domain-containing protein [Ruegeria arenilitoris]|uniref:DUF4760 domain-containing protein n=1 Tax=Ruegeria arenilitoris TaxID=1173585 RepID=UPI00147B2BEE|nr:hypothetical protein [Ruegeria arenilitoris]